MAAGVRPGLKVVILDPEQDGLLQLSAVLSTHPRLNAIHIIAHGEAGGLRLGNGWVRQDTLNAQVAALSQWFSLSHSGPRPKLLLYGCNVAKGKAGAAFVQRLAALTQADVAASDDWTGGYAKGGDWVLEYDPEVAREVELALGHVRLDEANRLREPIDARADGLEGDADGLVLPA